MSDSDSSSDGENESKNKLKSKIPDGFEIESLQEYEELKKKSHDKVQGNSIEVKCESWLAVTAKGRVLEPFRKRAEIGKN